MDTIFPSGLLETIENNLVFGNQVNYNRGPDLTGTDGNISEDPQFINSANNDFRLMPSSPAIDVGTNMSAPEFDFDGNFRPADGDGDGTATSDIGAFEAGSQMGVGLVVEGGLEHECNTSDGALITVSLTSNPADLEIASLKIFVNDQVVADSSPADVLAPLGVSQIRVEAVTDDGTMMNDSEFIKVIDTTPPLITAWFEDSRTGAVVNSIDSRRMEFLKIRIEADDICDPDPEVSSVLGSTVEDGQALRVRARRNEVSFGTKELTLMVSTTDANGNSTSLTTSLMIETPPPFDFRQLLDRIRSLVRRR